MSLLSELTVLLGEAFADQGLDSSYGEVVVSQRPDLCQFQCNGALGAAKSSGTNPRELGSKIANSIQTDPRIAEVEVAGPGFLNIGVSDEFLVEQANRLSNGFDLFQVEDKKVLIDYGGGNIAKSLHVGHLRPALIGESLKRIYQFAGYDTVGDYHLGDWGLPMGQLIAAIEDASPELPYFSDNPETVFPATSPVTIEDLETLYPQASQRCKTDDAFAEKARQATVELQNGHPGYRALWKHFRDISVASMISIYDQLGVTFELWLGEASVADRVTAMVADLKSRNVAVESDGALIIEVAQPDDTKELPPFMLLNSRGGLTYGTTDLATIEERVQDFAIDKMVYVVDNRQSLHFQQVFRAAQAAGMVTENHDLIHAANGTANGPDGKPLKTRDGDLPRLTDLLIESQKLAQQQLDQNNLAQDFDDAERKEIIRLVGLAALNYGELSNHRTTNYNFDLERFTQIKGQTGPHLQYVAVRAASTLAKTAEQGWKPGKLQPAEQEKERELILKLLQLPDIISRSIETNAPNTVAEYTYEIASAFNRFYDSCHILSEQNPERRDSWLALVALSRKILEKLLHLLCIQVPEKM